jgi:hypothetical protein
MPRDGFGDGAFGERTHDHRGEVAVGRILLHGLEQGRLMVRVHLTTTPTVGPSTAMGISITASDECPASAENAPGSGEDEGRTVRVI